MTWSDISQPSSKRVLNVVRATEKRIQFLRGHYYLTLLNINRFCISSYCGVHDESISSLFAWTVRAEILIIKGN